MKTPIKIAIVTALGLAIAGAVILKKEKSSGSSPDVRSNSATAASGSCCAPLAIPASLHSNSPSGAGVAAGTNLSLPRLVDLGAGKCIPCKMMAPILEEMRKDYAGKLRVDFIDVWQDPDAGKAFNINLIPTQIFFDSNGKELFRHEGFLSKEDILGKWKELGVNLGVSQ